MTIPLVCIPDAIPVSEREHYHALRAALAEKIQAVEETEYGYRLQLPGDSVVEAAQFITLERLCCPFLRFNLEVAEAQVSLLLTGPEGTKAFLNEELL